MTTPTLADWLAQEPFTLAMSSGFFGFFAHAGVLEALVEAGHVPRRVVGSSAGALVAGAYGAGVPPPELARELCAVRRAEFWDPGPGLGLLRGRRFRARLHALMGERRLEDAVLPTTLVVHDVLAHRPVPRGFGSMAAVIHASCAVPGLFQPVWLEGRPFLDGGILDRPALTALSPGERTLHHHLASRSPWRRKLEVPRRDNLVALVLGGLPRSGPFALPAGPVAYARAREATRAALRQPVGEILHVDASLARG
jgi:NTE family protein